jgi:LemA protein
MALVIILIVLAVLLIWGISTRNTLKRYLVMIDESKNNIDIALEQRYDTISEMLKIAKTYAKHEERVFTDLVKIRRGLSLGEMNEEIKAQETALREIFAVGEAYPEMASSQQFLNLQSEVAKENATLAAAKRIVNSNVSALNQMIASFPASVIAANAGIEPKDFLEINTAGKESLENLDYNI